MRSTTISALLVLALASFSTSSPTPYRHHINGNSHHTTETKHHNGASGHLTQEDVRNSHPGTDISKNVMTLKSGNLVITAHKSQILDTDHPDVANPDKLMPQGGAGQFDILRGKVSIQKSPKHHEKHQHISTAVAFRVPHEAKGKYCSFHFMAGAGDFITPDERAIIFSLDGNDNRPLEEFKTTWNNKPYRNHAVAEVHTGHGEHIATSEGDVGQRDSKFTYINAGPVQHVKHVDGQPAFLCDAIVGETQWEIVAEPNSEGRAGTWAWSMNKGLTIEVHGLPQSSHHQQHEQKEEQIEEEIEEIEEIEEDEYEEEEDEYEDEEEEYVEYEDEDAEY